MTSGACAISVSVQVKDLNDHRALQPRHAHRGRAVEGKLSADKTNYD